MYGLSTATTALEPLSRIFFVHGERWCSWLPPWEALSSSLGSLSPFSLGLLLSVRGSLKTLSCHSCCVIDGQRQKVSFRSLLSLESCLICSLRDFTDSRWSLFSAVKETTCCWLILSHPLEFFVENFFHVQSCVEAGQSLLYWQSLLNWH